MADNLSNDSRVSDTGAITDHLQATCLNISVSNTLNVHHTVGKSPPNQFAELSASTETSKPFRFLDLPPEVRFMIYYHAIGNKFLHISSNCDHIPNQLNQCKDEDPHQCLESKRDVSTTRFPFDCMHVGFGPVIHCQGSVLFHNRICTSPHIDVGDRNGFWSLSISQEIQTGHQTMEHGTRDHMKFADAKPLDYCPCVDHASISLSLNLLQTCRLIHTEASLIPYESNTFIFQEMETFAAFFGLVYPEDSDSNDNPTFAWDRSDAIYNMCHVRLQSRVATALQFLFVTRLLRAGLSLLGGLQNFELTLGILPCDMAEMYQLTIDDSLFGVSRSAKKVTVNIRNCIWTAREYPMDAERIPENQKTTMEQKQDLAAKLIERMLKVDGFQNKRVLFLGPV